ncbi:MAG TPA: DUF1028 domain-containing protein [Gaiellaceae bacterium]|nr:DUF1028 domain-containing protein [Gaiellaceae bacterium]
MTYSIVARDPETGELGAAVASRSLGLGSCIWARPGVGAVATQSFTEAGYGPRGLDLLAAGRDPADALAELLTEDERREYRQVAFLAADGRTAAHTGDRCIPDCGHLAAPGLSTQGNMLGSPEVWPAAAEAFAAATGSLAERLLAALDAGEAAGGDFHGRQAAALVLASGDPADPPWQTVAFRVEDHPEPLPELRRIHRLHATRRRRAAFGPDTDTAAEVELARAAGLGAEEVALTAALAESRRGDRDGVARALAPLAGADRRWREAFERYEELGLIQPAPHST